MAKKKTRGRGFGWIRAVVMVALALVFCFSSYQIYSYWREEHASASLNKDLAERFVRPAPNPPQAEPTQAEDVTEPLETAPITVDFAELLAENPDVVAWVYCPDTQINFPVAQSSDNKYYLYRLLDRTWNRAGTIFLDFRNSSDFSDMHSIVYGHNMKSQAMFGFMNQYREPDFYEAHPVWYLLTPERNFKVVLVAGYVTRGDGQLYWLDQTASEFDALLAVNRESSTFATDVEIADTDRFVTFSTCSYEFNDARYVLTGILREIG